jgi:hypothetical protein
VELPYITADPPCQVEILPLCRSLGDALVALQTVVYTAATVEVHYLYLSLELGRKPYLKYLLFVP